MNDIFQAIKAGNRRPGSNIRPGKIAYVKKICKFAPRNHCHMLKHHNPAPVIRILAACLLLICIVSSPRLIAGGAPQVRYTGHTLSNPYLHDGGLSPVVGTHCIQVMRANRSKTDDAHCQGWTYNHQPMLAHWNGRFFLHFLSDPASEHIPPSVTWFTSSADGYHWETPRILFPEYPVPDGFIKAGDSIAATGTKAVMHQRVGWYVSSKQTGSRLLAMGNYGICLYPKDDPNDGNGIGRVVREIFADGTLGPIYFLYLNHDFSDKGVRGGRRTAGSTAWPIEYPYFTAAKDKQFRAACQEILDNPLYRMQWVEEADRHDPLLPLDKPYKAFCYYTLPNDMTTIGLWKHALTSFSTDGGRTWSEPVQRAPGFVNSNAKIWGQRLSDGTYATVYNPAEFRWPLAVSTSVDGEEYTTLNLVHGEITPMRYGGNYKSYGPQYPRGILPGNGELPDLWVSYSVNKEDIWIARIPVPVRSSATAHADDDFEQPEQLNRWNLYMPAEATIRIQDGRLLLTDSDHFDFAKAERIIPATRHLSVSFDLTAGQTGHGTLQVEWLDEHGTPCSRLEWCGADSLLRIKTGARFNTLQHNFKAGKTYHIEARTDLEHRNITLYIDGKKQGPKMLFAPIESISRICFRTGDRRFFPTPETPADNDTDLPDADSQDPYAFWQIDNFKTGAIPDKGNPFVRNGMSGHPCTLLDFTELESYVARFNAMEDENIIQAIPNAEAAAWMKANVPLFECPDPAMTEMFYYRWWTLRKHLRETPVGYAMTEFLVPRSYADQYNLISCALGHHVAESRWLRDTTYLHQFVRTWLRGNAGGPMKRLDQYSSWLPYALWQQAKVSGQWGWLQELLPDLEADMARWDSLRLLPEGLYWQADVKDGMEESISGGRKVKNRRPTINSYMYGNFVALSDLCSRSSLPEQKARTEHYRHRAQELKQRIEKELWSRQLRFFCTRTENDSIAAVREAIGFIPWYFNLPDDNREYAQAWRQLTDPQGFSAPFGLTTAERRHPQFRSHGSGRCEWDGAIWPFATSQTLTALGNYINDYSLPPAEDSLLTAAFFRQMQLYTESQYRRGRPYIGEYLDETDGQWLMGDRERSRYYNHSTYNDLIITGLVGLRPASDNRLVIRPLLPAGQWSYFCLDGIDYHGHQLTISWDADGRRYHQGRGMSVWIDGNLAKQQPDLGKIEITLPEQQ